METATPQKVLRATDLVRSATVRTDALCDKPANLKNQLEMMKNQAQQTADISPTFCQTFTSDIKDVKAFIQAEALKHEQTKKELAAERQEKQELARELAQLKATLSALASDLPLKETMHQAGMAEAIALEYRMARFTVQLIIISDLEFEPP